MKRFVEGVLKWKTAACLMYTATMVIYLVFCLVFGNREVSTSMLWMLLLSCVCATLIQGICFSNWIIKKLRYTLRSILFVTLFLPVLSLIAWKGQWFPTENGGSWVIFVGTFFGTFILMTIGFDIYFRITGRKYDGLLGQYRREKEEKEE